MPCLAEPCENNERCFGHNKISDCRCSFNYDGKYGEKSIDLSKQHHMQVFAYVINYRSDDSLRMPTRFYWCLL